MQENVVWTSTLDGRYEVTVIRTDEYHGELTISEGDQILHRESVGLSYGAIFGPDVQEEVRDCKDVRILWVHRACSRNEDRTLRPRARIPAGLWFVAQTRTPRLRGVQRSLSERSLTTKAY